VKLRIKSILQHLLGLQLYLFLFSLVKIRTLRWDKHESDFLTFLEMIPSQGIIIDVGANIGIMTVLFARNAPHSTVYAFEPMPTNFQVLKRVVQWYRLENAIVFPYAIGNEEKTITIMMPVAGNVRLQGLSFVVGENNTAQLEGDVATAQCKRLDDVMSLFSNDSTGLTALKIDVEGYEFYVLDGARKMLKTYRPLIYCELSNKQDECFQLLRELEYTVKVLQDKKLLDFDPAIHGNNGNFFFIPLDKNQISR
jgi:FkbM family methyltransferase